MKKVEIINAVAEALENLSEEQLVEILNDGYIDGEIYPMEEFNEVFENFQPLDIMEMLECSDNFSSDHNWFIGYGCAENGIETTDDLSKLYSYNISFVAEYLFEECKVFDYELELADEVVEALENNDIDEEEEK